MSLSIDWAYIREIMDRLGIMPLNYARMLCAC